MNVEKIFRDTGFFENIKMDTVLVESRYPVMFTCIDQAYVYLFICCMVNAKIAKWIGTRTEYTTLIALLQDRITIREAFLSGDTEKIMIDYSGKEKAVCKKINRAEIPDFLLPTKGEYMEAEDGEFDEEISLFRFRNANTEVLIKPQKKYLIYIKPSYRVVTLEIDDYDPGEYAVYNMPARMSDYRMQMVLAY